MGGFNIHPFFGKTVKEIPASKIIEIYDHILMDAFGVLVNADGPIQYAAEFILALNELGIDYHIVSNGSKFLPSRSAQSYRDRGLAIPDEKVITSGSLLKSWYESNPSESLTKMLGPKESMELLMWAGAELVDGDTFSTFVICNQDGFDFPKDVDTVISEIIDLTKKGRRVNLLLPNPDLIYPSKNGFGLTSGSIALIIEKALELVLDGDAPKFERLGKPYPAIFAAAPRSSTAKTCMIGDQYETDIFGANRAGIDSILVDTGISRNSQAALISEIKKPKFFIRNLRLDKTNN